MFSPLSKIGVVVKGGSIGIDSLSANGCLYMNDLLLQASDSAKTQWTPLFSSPVVGGAGLSSNDTLELDLEAQATIVNWAFWRSITNGSSVVLSRDTGPGYKYYNTPLYNRYYNVDDVLFESPFDSAMPPYDLDRAKANSLVVNVTGDIRVFPSAAIAAGGSAVFVFQAGQQIGIFGDPRSGWLGALVIPTGLRVSIDWDASASAPSLMYVQFQLYCCQFLCSHASGTPHSIKDQNDRRWNLWGLAVDDQGAVMPVQTAHSRLVRPPQISMLFFAATSFFGTRPILSGGNGEAYCWDHRIVVSAESLMGGQHPAPDLGDCVYVPFLPSPADRSERSFYCTATSSGSLLQCHWLDLRYPS